MSKTVQSPLSSLPLTPPSSFILSPPSPLLVPYSPPTPLSSPVSKTSLTGSTPSGLSLLVKECLGKPLDKTLQMSDWDRRPLLTEQVKYAGVVKRFSIHILQQKLKVFLHFQCSLNWFSTLCIEANAHYQVWNEPNPVQRALEMQCREALSINKDYFDSPSPSLSLSLSLSLL